MTSFAEDLSARTASRASLGSVRAVYPDRILVSLTGPDARGVQLGDLLMAEGPMPLVARVTAVESPPAEADAELAGILVAEAEIAPPNGRSGYPVVGASVHPFPFSEALMQRHASLRGPLPIGEAEGDVFALDTDSLRTCGLSIIGDDETERRSALAVVVRALLRSGFPARMVFLDPEGLFTHSFGAAASIVDCSEALVPAGLMSAEELSACLAVAGGALTAEERRCLDHLVSARAGRPLSDYVDYCDRQRGEGPAGSVAAWADLGARLRAAARDLRLAPFFGAAAEDLTAEDLLQVLFRLPDGRPPMAVCQFQGMARELQPIAASVVARLARVLAMRSAGRIPVLMIADNADVLLPQPVSLPEHFSTLFAGKTDDGPVAGRPRITCLAQGEAIFTDPALPWEPRFTVDRLPDRAVPRRVAEGPAEAGPHALLEAIAEAFQKPLVS